MEYLINKTNYRDFSVFEDNKRKARAYFIPYSKRETLDRTKLKEERYNSDLVDVLSGEWEFKYYSDISELKTEINSDELDYKTIHVPSTWQRTGIEPPVYLNCYYEFEETPPKLPKKMSVGVYRKKFEVTDADDIHILSFLGVIPCIDVYINGRYVGYSEGAHNTAEFDISDFIYEGTNELLAVVHKWSTGTYLECQDMFRENGIFRDVLLYKLPQTYINDFYIRPLKSNDKWSMDVNVEIEGKPHGCQIAVSLLDCDKVIASNSVDAEKNNTIHFDDLDVAEWNAEIPTNYQVIITLNAGENEIMTLRSTAGFKDIQIKKNVFTINGQKIKIKGVNHHDSHYKNGYVMSFEDYEKDVKIIKSLNCNCIRTSHYPPDPNLITLCDIYGIYIIDEADIETHGACFEPHNKPTLISHDKKWAPRYLDRVSRMYYRDRSHPCIIMWSLGNEAWGYNCQDICYDFLHNECPEIPVHYESVIHTKRKAYDVTSEMYTCHEDIEKVGKGKRAGSHYKDRPFFLCEYAHAMGVGPGSLEDYWKLFYKYDNLMGGCIWEFSDHAVYHEDSEYKYTYGGDHGERKHDGNFCVDGLVHPDRTLSSGALEAKAVYRPIRASLNNDGSIRFKNTNSFKSSDYITICWKSFKNGIQDNEGQLKLNIPPFASEDVNLELNVPKGCDYRVNFEYFDDRCTSIACEQVTIKSEKQKINVPKGKLLEYSKIEDKIYVKFDNGKVVFNCKKGELESYTIGDKELINQTPASCFKGFAPNIYRAYLDNDMFIAKKWAAAGYDNYEIKFKDMEIEPDNKKVEIKVTYRLKADKCVIAEVLVEYQIKKSGAIKVESTFKPVNRKRASSILPRFGLTLEMPQSFENVQYFGYGPFENESDFKEHCSIGIFESTVTDMEEYYIRPQDSGTRTGIQWVKLTDSDGDGLLICNPDRALSFNAKHYTQKLLQNAKHSENLHSENTTVLFVDGYRRGTGSNSCGPEPLDTYTVDGSKGLKFEFTIIPIKGE